MGVSKRIFFCFVSIPSSLQLLEWSQLRRADYTLNMESNRKERNTDVQMEIIWWCVFCVFFLLLLLLLLLLYTFRIHALPCRLTQSHIDYEIIFFSTSLNFTEDFSV